MNAQTINQTYDLATLVLSKVNLKKSGAYLIGPCPLCEGKDRFTLKRFATGAQGWLCRKCSEVGKWQSAIDFYMALYSLPFTEAARRMAQELGGNLEAQPRIPRPQPSAPARLEVTRPEPAFTRPAWRAIDEAHQRLQNDPKAEAARAYLTERRIPRALWGLAGLGFGWPYGRPAIYLPWYTEARERRTQTLYGVRYRFIDDLAKLDRKQKVKAMIGSKFHLYGVFGLARQVKDLFICEGEFNCLSLRVVAPPDMHVFSVGAELLTGIQKQCLQDLEPSYRHIYVWMDEPAKAQDIQRLLNRPAERITLINSPERNGKKYDANQCAQEGFLDELLALHNIAAKQYLPKGY